MDGSAGASCPVGVAGRARCFGTKSKRRSVRRRQGRRPQAVAEPWRGPQRSEDTGAGAALDVKGGRVGKRRGGAAPLSRWVRTRRRRPQERPQEGTPAPRCPPSAGRPAGCRPVGLNPAGALGARGEQEPQPIAHDVRRRSRRPIPGHEKGRQRRPFSVMHGRAPAGISSGWTAGPFGRSFPAP